MKKILSLLVLLVTTLSAFALDFTDYRKVTLGYNTPTESNDAKLSITDNGDGTYNVTFNDIITVDGTYTDNYGTFTFSNVSGSTSGGVTTVTGTDLAGTVSGGDYGITEFTKGNLSLKFKDGKAYATMTATCRVFYSNYTFDVVFGTDEGFDGGSTGGGETGGEVKEDYYINFDKSTKNTHASRYSTSVSLQQVGKDKQTISFNSTKDGYEDLTASKFTVEAGSEVTPSIGYVGEWMHGYVYIDLDNNKQFSFNAESDDQTGTDVVSYSFYTTATGEAAANGKNSKGETVASNCNVNPLPSFTAPATPGTYRIRFKVDWNNIDAGGGVAVGQNICANGGGIWDATLEVVAPAPTVDKEVPFTGVAFSVSNGLTGNADVTFKEMSDKTVQMTFASSSYNISATNLTKDTDAKGRTTYTGEAVNDAMSSVTYTVKAVVYTEGGTEKLYMTLVAADGTKFTVGEDPDYVAPVTYKNTLYVVENAKLLVETADAEVVLLDKGDNKYDITLPAFTAGGMNVPSITFEATKADNKLTASNVSVADVYSGEAAVVTMDGTFEADGKLFASLTVKCGEWFDYEVGYGIKPFVATTKEYTAEWANVKVGDAEPVNFQKAKADYTEFAKGQYSLTFKDLTFGEKKIGDFTIKYVNENAYGELSTTAAAGTWTRVEAGQDVASLGDEASISGFEGVIGGTGDGTLFVKFTINAYGTVAVDFGHKYEAPEPPVAPKDVTVVEKYQADGSGFSKTINVDWDKQKIVASIDFSNGGDDKDILAMTTGDSFTAFQTSTYRTMHWYCDQTAKQMSGFFAKDGAGNNNTGRMDVADCLAKFEISKAEGLKVNGEVKMTPTVLEELLTGDPIIIGSGESPKFSNAYYNYIKVVSLDWKEPTEPEVTVKEEKTFNEALYMVQGTTSTKVADAKVVVKEMSDNTVNMSLQFNGNEYTSTELVKGTDEKNRTTYTGKVSKDTQTFDVAGVVYEKETADRLYMTMTAAGVTFVVGENPDAVTPDVTEVSNKTYTSNLRILDGEEPVVENAEAQVNIIKYSDDSYKVTLKNVNMLNKTQDLVFVGKVITDVTDSEAPLTIMAKSDEATTNVFGEQVSGTFEITEVSADEIKMGFSMESQNFSYQGEFNYTEEEEPEVYTNNLHIYDAAAPETDLFQADQAKVEFLATETGEFKLTLKDVTLNEKTQDLVFTGALPTPQPGGQDPLAEEGETTPAEPAMVLNAIADEATTDFFGGGATYATAVFNVSYDKNDNFMMTFTIAAAAGKNYAGEFNYVKKTPDTPDPELFCKENYVADGEGFEWEIAVDWDTQKIVMSIDPSTCTGSCEDVIGLGAVPTAWDNTLHLYRTSADQMLQGYFQTSADNNNTGKFAETAPFLVEVSKAQGFVVNNEVKIAASEMSYLFTLPTVKMGTGEGANDKSRATYNYVKVVDKDWTAPKDPDTGINATTVAEGEVEFFTVNGVKLNKLQKGLNIVRTADGKVKKVLVK